MPVGAPRAERSPTLGGDRRASPGPGAAHRRIHSRAGLAGTPGGRVRDGEVTPPGTFERGYAAIRQRLREGLYRPGDRLETAILSEELNASVTPVRVALHRLTGVRLGEARRHERCL